MVASYNEETDTWSIPTTDDATEKPKRHRRTKEEMDEARARGEVTDKAPAGRGRTSLKTIITDLVQTINVAVYTLPWTHDDALNEEEAALLIDGIDKAQQVSPALKRFLQSGARLSGWGALIYASTIIALPRMQRHGLIPTFAVKEPPTPYENGYNGSVPDRNGYVPDFSSSVATG